jgi:predicted deacylase
LALALAQMRRAARNFELSNLRARILRASAALNLTIQTLGEVDGEPIWLITPPNPCNRLVAAGFHGDEIAGPWGVLNYLEHAAIDNKPINISFLPIVNPTGLNSNTRTNKYEEDPNRGFCHSTLNSRSKEGDILFANIKRILELSSDGFLSLHEDSAAEEFYLYSFEEGKEPGHFSKRLGHAVAGILTTDNNSVVADSPAKNGIIFGDCDGSFEDFLFHAGVSRTACTETPGLLGFNTRVAANRILIDTLSIM